MILTLPWPDRRLSPNELERFFRMLLSHPGKARGAYFAWESRVKQARYEGEMTARSVFIPGEDIPYTGSLRVTYRLYPPTRRHYDQDGVLSSCKHMIDGICKGLLIDDWQFKQTVIEWGEPIKGGKIEMVIEEM